MGIFRLLRYKYLLNSRRKRYASLAVSIALAQASFGAIKYKSVGNGMADIELSLEEGQKVKLHFNRLDKDKEYVVKGNWTVENDEYVLQFNRSRLDISDLFANNTGFQKISTIEDGRTVRIPSFRGGVMIWGIYCPRLSA